MPDLFSEEEFTERFTQHLTGLSVTAKYDTPLIIHLHYGENEPVLTISLKDAYKEYQNDPEKFESIVYPFLQDIRWTAQEPRHGAQNIYEHIIPILRNFTEMPPLPEEMENNSKGPIAYTEVLRTNHEYLVAQFMLHQEGKDEVPLRRGDVLSCMPDPAALTQLAFRNMAQIIDTDGISAFPLQFESLKARSWLVGLGQEKHNQLVSSLTCIPQAMLSLEETLQATEGIIAIIPSRDQLIVSIDVDEQSMYELGMLAQQLRERAPYPLSSLIWKFKGGALEGVQALEMEEQNP